MLFMMMMMSTLTMVKREGNKASIIGNNDTDDWDHDGMMSLTPHLRKVRQFWPCQSFGSFLIQSYLNTNLGLVSFLVDNYKACQTKYVLHHKMSPCNLSPSVIPGPVAVVVIAVRSVNSGSDPPLVVVPVHHEDDDCYYNGDYDGCDYDDGDELLRK